MPAGAFVPKRFFGVSGDLRAWIDIPESLAANLYWGAAYGAERFLSSAPEFTVDGSTDGPYPERPHVLRELLLSRRATGAEREPDADLLLACDRSGQQEIGDVHASDQ